MKAGTNTVLIVEDEVELAELYATWLEGAFECRVAYDGERALELADPHVDAILLDRRMPGISGDDVLESLRDRDVDCPVGMVTAVAPGFDIVEMGFDDYVVKPIEKNELITFVESLLSLTEYERELRRYYQLANKRAALETTKSTSELENNNEYTALLEDLEDAKRTADQERDQFGGTELFTKLF